MSDLLWESRSDKCGVRLCCAQLCMLVENSGFTSSRPHKCGDHITHQMCSSTFDAGNLPVRFDEREQETESCQTGLRGRGRKPGHTPTGRLSSLRLFSTLLPITLVMPSGPSTNPDSFASFH